MTKEHEWQEALATVDVSALESLKRLKQEQDLIDERLRAMSALKDSVAVTVYQRVFEDYQKRRQQLESEAAPQKHKVRAEFAKLHDLLANFESIGCTAEFADKTRRIAVRFCENFNAGCRKLLAAFAIELSNLASLTSGSQTSWLASEP